MLQLVKPNREYLPSVFEAIEEYKMLPSRFAISAVKQMVKASENNFIDYFMAVEKAELGIGIKLGYVPDTIYWLVEDGKYIGTFDLRHRLTSSLKEIGGHIAYQIRPSKLRKGYCSKGLELCLEKAREIGIKQALVTCNAQNIASYGLMCKVMNKVGGYEDEPIQKGELTEKRDWLNT